MREEQEMREKMVQMGTIPSEDLNRLEMDDKFEPSLNLGSETAKFQYGSDWDSGSLDAKSGSNLGSESLDMEHGTKLGSEPQDNGVTESKSQQENKRSYGTENYGASAGENRTESTKNDNTKATTTTQEKDKAEEKKISFLQGFLGKNSADKIAPKNPNEHETTHRL